MMIAGELFDGKSLEVFNDQLKFRGEGEGVADGWFGYFSEPFCGGQHFLREYPSSKLAPSIHCQPLMTLSISL